MIKVKGGWIMKKATMQDVANLAGVSQASVSLILNNNEKITFSNETRERVFQAAKQLNYKLPRRKRNIDRRNNNIILLLVPSMGNPYYAEITREVSSYAETKGYHAIVVNTFHRPDTEKFYLDQFLGQEADGVIYSFLPSFPRLLEQAADNFPVVMIGEKESDIAVCSIELSNVNAGNMLAEHLTSLGHKRLAFFVSCAEHLDLAREQRIAGIRRRLVRDGLGEDALDIFMLPADHQMNCFADTDEGPAEYAAGRRLAADFLASGCPATGLIAANDIIALGVMKKLQEEGYDIPKDYSICGFDNIFTSSITTPPLTTVDLHLRTRCRAAVDMLIEQNEGFKRERHTPFLNKIEYSPKLIVRDSSGRAEG